MELTKTKYKQTEVGLIPEDWDSLDLNELGATGRPVIKAGPFGSSLKKEFYVSEGYKIYGQEQVIKNDAFYGDYFINQERYRKLKSCEVIPGDILISLVGTFGKILVIPDNALKGIINPRLLRISVDKTKFHIEYISHFLKSTKALDVLESKLQGGTMGVLNAGILKSFQIPLPPTLTEQKAIATALSDVDDLVANLDKLITKKKAIKQGTMQQLLTPPHKGGKRLAGFTGEWVEKKLGDCLKYEQPTKYIVENSDYEGQSQIPVLTAGKSFLLGYTDEDFGVFNHHPVIIFDDFTTSNQFVNFSFKVKSSAMKMLQPVTEEINIEFMFSIMNQIRFSLGDDHKRRWIAEYSKIEVFVPEIEEQKAIAQILTDMDLEIEQLEMKKAKYQDIKQGMMQELLTGKIRLI